MSGEGAAAGTINKTCAMCGRNFEARGRAAKFCGECREKAKKENISQWRKKNRAAAEEAKRKSNARAAEKRAAQKPKTIICQRCGKATEYRPNLKFCPECRRAHDLERQRKYQKTYRRTGRRTECKAAPAKAAVRKKRKKPLSLAECCRIASEHGMTYGEGAVAGLY